ncbi:unnamed protein product, partial [Discosporangium mesarthrocarpum]
KRRAWGAYDPSTLVILIVLVRMSTGLKDPGSTSLYRCRRGDWRVSSPPKALCGEGCGWARGGGVEGGLPRPIDAGAPGQFVPAGGGAGEGAGMWGADNPDAGSNPETRLGPGGWVGA